MMFYELHQLRRTHDAIEQAIQFGPLNIIL